MIKVVFLLFCLKKFYLLFSSYFLSLSFVSLKYHVTDDWEWKSREFSLVFWMPQITAFVSVTNIAVTGGDNSKESSVHFFFKLCLSLPIYCHNFTHRAALEPSHCSEIVRVTKTSDNQSPDHQPMRARACCLHSLSVLFPLSPWAGRPHNLNETWGTLTRVSLFCVMAQKWTDHHFRHSFFVNF